MKNSFSKVAATATKTIQQQQPKAAAPVLDDFGGLADWNIKKRRITSSQDFFKLVETGSTTPSASKTPAAHSTSTTPSASKAPATHSIKIPPPPPRKLPDCLTKKTFISIPQFHEKLKQSGKFAVMPILKPLDFTSFDAVAKVRGMLIRSGLLTIEKVGHSGTLDPQASGVLVILLNDATTLMQHYTAIPKTYKFTARIGQSTASMDHTSPVLRHSDEKEATRVVGELQRISFSQVEQALSSLVGSYAQTVPIYSAMRVNGKRLLQVARKMERKVIKRRAKEQMGEQEEEAAAEEAAAEKEEVMSSQVSIFSNVEEFLESRETLPKKQVMVHSAKVLQYTPSVVDGVTRYIDVDIETTVGSGTFVRSMAFDLAEKLGNLGGHTTMIHRVSCGGMDASESFSMEEIIDICGESGKKKV